MIALCFNGSFSIKLPLLHLQFVIPNESKSQLNSVSNLTFVLLNMKSIKALNN